MINIDVNKIIEFGFDKKEKNLTECMTILFPEYWHDGQKTIELTVDELRSKLQEVETTLDYALIEGMKHDEDVSTVLKEIKGSELKDLLLNLFEEKNIAFESKKFSNLKKDAWKDVFFVLFHITPEKEGHVPLVPPVSTGEHSSQTVLTGSQEDGETVSLLKDASAIRDIYQEALAASRVEDITDMVDSTDIILHDGMSVTRQNKHYFYPESVPVSVRFTAVIDDSDSVIAVGSFEPNEDGSELFYLFDVNNTEFKAFGANKYFTLLLIPAAEEKTFFKAVSENPDSYKGKVYIKKNLAVERKEPKKKDQPLCIDFGTSNTTAGSYGIFDEETNEVELVKFEDKSTGTTVEHSTIPTLIYVEDCSNADNIRYSFGYEARQKIKAQDYDTKASVFYELKRWMSELDEKETISDENGHICEIQRFELVKAYIEHIIKLSEKFFRVRFKNLHFSAPVRMKEGFIRQMKKMFEPEYQVYAPEDSLDEGIAIVYNQIANRVRNLDKRYQNGKPVYKESEKMNANEYMLIPEDKPERILVMDCGGGTTDLASCEYWCKGNMTLNNLSLTIHTGFENGDPNFGGNNITFRILQIIKIKLANYLSKEENISMIDVIPDKESNILARLDKSDVEKDRIYESFEKAYCNAENYVPTKFADVKLQKRRRLVKRNFYYLWQIAENVKVEFYKSARVRVDFSREEDREISVGDASRYHLAVNRAGDAAGVLEDCPDPMADIEITINEIERVITPDIYSLLNDLLAYYTPDKEHNDLLKFSHIKLSGQSCNITLFHDLMKEFIPGKLIRRKEDEEVDGVHRDTLKMSCIRGCIKYLRDRDNNTFILNIDRSPEQALLYSLWRKQDKEREVCMLRQILDNPEEKKFEIAIDQNTDMAKNPFFVIKNRKGEEIKKFSSFIRDVHNPVNPVDGALAIWTNYISKGTYLDSQEVKNEIRDALTGVKVKDSTNIIVFVAMPAKEANGFRLYQILVKDEGKDKKYFMQNTEGEFISFEPSNLKVFFNGER